jgi:hypothetical protein
MWSTLLTSAPSPWQSECDRVQRALDRYRKGSLAAIGRLKSLENSAHDTSRKLQLLEMLEVETQKQERRHATFEAMRKGTVFLPDCNLKVQKKQRFERFVNWLKEMIEEMEGVGVEEQRH